MTPGADAVDPGTPCTPREARGLHPELVGSLGEAVGDTRGGERLVAPEREVEELVGRRQRQGALELGGKALRGQASRHAGDHHARAAGRDDRAERVEDVGDPQEVDVEDPVRRRLGRREAGRMDHLHDGARSGRGVGEIDDRPRGGHVDHVPVHLVPLAAQRLDGPVQACLVEVGEDEPPARALAPRDRLAHTSDADHDDDFVSHGCSPRCSQNTIETARLVNRE
jgi:hypothetical protein